MKNRLFVLLAALMMLPTFASAEQNLRSGYFLDGYIYKYKMNPAMAPERGFFAMPALGNLSLAAETNLGLSTFIYPTQTGRLTTFLSPTVSAEDFLQKISDNNNLNFNMNMNILALGFRTGKAYHTVDFSARVDAGLNMPGSLLRFIKAGSSLGDYTWDISNIGAKGSARAELAYGYSRSFGESLRVGARAKLLFGFLHANCVLDKMALEMSAEKWSVQSHGSMMFAGPFSLGTSQGNKVNLLEYETENVKSNLMKPNMGFAVDLGATYEFLDYFTASLSVLDLGFITWRDMMIGSTPETAWTFDGFGNVDVDMDAVEDQLAGLATDFTGALGYEQGETNAKKTLGIAATIHAGIDARMPFYERLTFGFLFTQRIDGVYSMSEGRWAMGLAPTNWFSLTTNYAISNFGHSWGGAVNIHLRRIGIFAGLDSFSPLLNVTPQMIPIDPINTNLAVGLNFTFGKYHGRYPKKAKDTKKDK